MKRIFKMLFGIVLIAISLFMSYVLYVVSNIASSDMSVGIILFVIAIPVFFIKGIQFIIYKDATFD